MNLSAALLSFALTLPLALCPTRLPSNTQAAPAPAATTPLPSPAPDPLQPDSRRPAAALKYRRTLAKEVNFIWGIEQPKDVFAAQIHAESRWKPAAISPAGARGLGQQMPSTEAWLEEIEAGLAGGDALDPAWSIRALVFYDKWLDQRLRAADHLNQWAFILAAYNGGIGNLKKEQKAAEAAGDNAGLWFSSVERFCNRRPSACTENRRYPSAILFDYRPIYAGF